MWLMIAWWSCLAVFFLLQASHIAYGVLYNITTAEPLFPNQTLVSSGQIFELGFFTPNGSENQYVGIWYKNLTPSRTVWVANRERPLMYTDQSAKLTIGNDGNLKLVDGQQNIVWSTNVSSRSNYTLAVLLDSGNFVLQDGDRIEIWGSFDDPTDTLLPGMKMGVNVRTGVKELLISWKSDSDPSPGKFSTGMTSEMAPQLFTWNGSTPYWRSGQWDGSDFIGMPVMRQTYLTEYTVQQDIKEGTTYFSMTGYYSDAYIFISPAGSLNYVFWNDKDEAWLTLWLAGGNTCDIYGTCGPFGVCNFMNYPICRCIDGFVPKSNEEWNRGNWSRGCIRETELHCQKSVSTSTKIDVFWQMREMKIPDFGDYLTIGNQEECESWCLSNCSCLAYSYLYNIGCMVWSKDLIDLRQFESPTTGQNLFVRVAYLKAGGSGDKAAIVNLSTIGGIRVAFAKAGGSRHKAAIISLSTIGGILLCALLVFGLCKRRGKKKGKTEKSAKKTRGNTRKEQLRQDDSLELNLYSFDSILLATNNFSTTNKLGQGGFGWVYKGKLKDGKEVAVKRLSSTSAQGVEEFRNEIILISKLQHRNLVKLLGYSMEGEEKILIYEYLSNKSLDSFLFDSRKKAELDWGKRFQIIQGIARGLLYLHRDSCLRVIHRDLKVSNILLDEQMNPKISDFGLARMFEGTQALVNTRKIVGTLGYMSPEYAMGGIFSERSDVYSFGVLLLEIISSKKNTDTYDHGQHLNLLSYAWQLWSEGGALDLMDEAIAVNSPLEVTRCINTGLLCVQDQATDRPNMSKVVLMLSGESDLPQPRQPIFTFQAEILPSQKESRGSVNTVTNTMVEGR